MNDSLAEANNFRQAIMSISDQYEGNYARSLEEYLRSLWIVINRYKGQTVSYQLFAKVTQEAFDAEPGEFDDRWLTYKKELAWDYRDGKYVIQEYKNGDWVITQFDVDDFEILTHTILCQIADLHRMRDKQLTDPNRWFGIDSPTGNRWYNFDVFGYWECATRGVLDHLRSSESFIRHRLLHCTWALFAAFLELGQSYE